MVFVFQTGNLINRKQQWAITGGFGAGGVCSAAPQAAKCRHESGLVRISTRDLNLRGIIRHCLETKGYILNFEI